MTVAGTLQEIGAFYGMVIIPQQIEKGEREMDDIEQIDYKGYTIKIGYDSFPENPRDWDNLGTMVCWHRRYTLGDEQPKCSAEEYQWNLVASIENLDDDQFDRDLMDELLNKHFIMLPLYLYDHSGITMSTGPFSCPWDSGQVGFIYVSKEKADKEFRYGAKQIEKIQDHLRHEVELYDFYLRGESYYFIIEDSNGIQVDSCGGFLGSDFEHNGLLEHAHDGVDADMRYQEKQDSLFETCMAL